MINLKSILKPVAIFLIILITSLLLMLNHQLLQEEYFKECQKRYRQEVINKLFIDVIRNEKERRKIEKKIIVLMMESLRNK